MYTDFFIKFLATYLIFILGLIALFVVYKRRIDFARELFIICVSVIVGYILARFLGLFYYHEQPFLNEGFLPIVNHGPNNAFPSDHATASSVLATFVYLRKKSLGYIAIAFALAIGLGRIFGGVHYFIDVIVGLFIGVISVLVVEKIFSYFNLSKVKN